jgi:hypothetical protein
MTVSGYVHAPFEEVMAELRGPRSREVLRTAIAAGLGFASDVVDVEISAVERYAGGAARIELSWHGDDGAGRVRGGRVTVTVLVVQSGDDAVTELLVRTLVDTAAAAEAAAAIRRCLDELSERLKPPQLGCETRHR